MKVVIYSRVSTNLQDFQRQTAELREYSLKMGYEVVRTFEEKISGARKNEDRPQLMSMINYIKENSIDKVLCWELSRIGRNSFEVLKTINLLNDNKISLYIKNYNLETLNAKGERDPMTQFMVEILNSVSEMEKTTIKSRVKSGYENFRLNGGVVGRKKGFKKDNDQILSEHKDVVKFLKQGHSVRNVMALSKKSNGTVQKVKKLIDG